MKFLGNVIWFIFGGFLLSVIYFLIGVILFITIIGIPFANQCFKLSKLLLFPFGKNVTTNFDRHPFANILWLLIVGWEMFLSKLFIGVLFCITIIGIPFGLQWFKLAILSLIPFGATIR